MLKALKNICDYVKSSRRKRRANKSFTMAVPKQNAHRNGAGAEYSVDAENLAFRQQNKDCPDMKNSTTTHQPDLDKIEKRDLQDNTRIEKLYRQFAVRRVRGIEQPGIPGFRIVCRESTGRGSVRNPGSIVLLARQSRGGAHQPIPGGASHGAVSVAPSPRSGLSH